MFIDKLATSQSVSRSLPRNHTHIRLLLCLSLSLVLFLVSLCFDRQLDIRLVLDNLRAHLWLSKISNWNSLSSSLFYFSLVVLLNVQRQSLVLGNAVRAKALPSPLLPACLAKYRNNSNKSERERSNKRQQKQWQNMHAHTHTQLPLSLHLCVCVYIYAKGWPNRPWPVVLYITAIINRAWLCEFIFRSSSSSNSSQNQQ